MCYYEKVSILDRTYLKKGDNLNVIAERILEKGVTGIPDAQKLPVVEGRVVKIELPAAMQVSWLKADKNSPVCIKFVGRNGKYIYLYDHRKASVDAFRKDGWEGWESVRGETPCLCSFRNKIKMTGAYSPTLYIALTDINDPGSDIVDEKQKYALTVIPEEDNKAKERWRKKWRILRGTDHELSLHPATGLCLCTRRNSKA